MPKYIVVLWHIYFKKIMLDKGTLNILNSIRYKSWLFESEENQGYSKDLQSDDEAYSQLVNELGEQLTNVPLKIEYFRYTRPDGGTQPIIEVSGSLQGSLNFIYKYGLDDGVFINVNNFKLKDATPESIRILYVYYNTKFQSLCKQLVER